MLSLPPRASVSSVPGAVSAATVTTIATAGITGAAVLFAAIGYAVVGRTVLENFDGTGSIVAWFFAIVGTVLGLCAAALVAGVGLILQRRWAWWALLVLAPVTAVLGVLASYHVLPLLVTAAASVVFVLLLLPSTRAWIVAPRQ